MELTLKRPLVFFDLETTGINIVVDRIVEISYLKIFTDGTEEQKTQRINPEMPIPDKSTVIHGITDEDVKDSPTFREYAKTFSKQLTKKEKFRKVFNGVLEENRDYNYCRFTLSNIQIINKYKNKLLTSYKLNVPECKRQILSGLNSINIKNVKFIIMHVSSKIKDDEKQIVRDNVYQIFTFIPIIAFKSDRTNSSTFIEIIYFGENVKKYQTEEPW